MTDGAVLTTTELAELTCGIDWMELVSSLLVEQALDGTGICGGQRRPGPPCSAGVTGGVFSFVAFSSSCGGGGSLAMNIVPHSQRTVVSSSCSAACSSALHVGQANCATGAVRTPTRWRTRTNLSSAGRVPTGRCAMV